MATTGFIFLVAAFAAALVSVAAFLVGGLAARKIPSKTPRKTPATATSAAATPATRIGRVAVAATFTCLLVCCGILVFCFMVGDVSLLYVLQERSVSTSSIAWLYKLAGLWAGRQGSLLFWTFLISVFNLAVLLGTRKGAQPLDHMALLVSQAVVLVFAGVLLFSADNMPFTPTPASYFAADGQLTAAASQYSMNQLLEHWAMAIHPPTLFVGYAGLTIPFAYALAALAVNDPSATWVQRATRPLLVSWFFLTAGIGLGAVWAYVVLGWGGYWGWDPVENASLLPWLISVALIHTFTVYRQRGAFKRWGVMCACLAFVFVVVATFITRSGIVQSVHAFAGDPVSLVLFGGLILVALAVSVVGVALRWKEFGADVAGADDVDSLFSKDAAYYFNNVIMVVLALLITYMTLAPSLPVWLPFGGNALGAAAYKAIAQPLGVVYLLILAVCPLLAWGKTDPKKFWALAKVPAVCALALFVLLVVYFARHLLPAYDAMLAAGGTYAEALLETGPPLYHHILALAAFLVASLLVFNALFQLVRLLRAPRKRASALGGTLAHLGMGVILVGLVGSSMYVTQTGGYLATGQGEEAAAAVGGAEGESEDAAENAAAAVGASGAPTELVVQGYTIRYADDSVTDLSAESHVVVYEAVLDVSKDGKPVGQLHPQVQLSTVTQQQKLNAAVMGFADEDLFVVYHGVNYQGDFAIEVLVNPLIRCVWAGFFLVLAGAVVAACSRRGTAPRTGEGTGGGTAEAEAEGAGKIATPAPAAPALAGSAPAAPGSADD